MTAQHLSQDVLSIKQQIIPEAELKKILWEFNQTARDYPTDKCIHQLFEEQVERTPDAIAVVLEEQQLTYQSLNQKANKIAHDLQSGGVKPEVLVGLCVERSLSMVIGMLGILKAGGAYVPLDPNYPAERIAYMVSDAVLSVVVTQRHLVDLISASDAKVVCLDSDSEMLAGESQHNLDSGVKPENLVYVIYTSGSTGKPKGVMIEHRSVVNATQASKSECQISSGDRVLQFASVSFDVAVQEIYPCLTTGGTVVLRTQQMLNSIATFVQQCQEWNLTVLHLPPAFWHELITELARTKQPLPPSVRLIMIGGERALPEKFKLWREYVQQMLHSHNLESPQLYNAYGPTETTVDATYCNLSKYVVKGTLSSVPIGRPIANAQIYILDPELQPVAIGVQGELHIGGAGLARGYLHRPDLTTEKFIQNPFEKVNRLYKTGDLARYLPDGNIELFGRIDNQVKVRGFRIELSEIELILEQHPGIQQAVVIAKEDQFRDKRLVAYVVLHLVSGDSVEQEIVSQLREFLQEKLPEYMRPTAFGVLEKLPLTPNDKVDRQALAKLPIDSYLLGEKTYTAPRTPEEKMLASVWAEVLDIERVGINDNFFELGGNSLKAIVLLNRLQEQLGKTLQMVDIFKAPTIAELVVWLQEQSTSSQETINRIAAVPNGDSIYYPLSFIQERFLFHQKLNSTNRFFHTPDIFRLVGPLNVAALEQSFNEIIRRHEILRTTLQEVNDALMQVVAPTATVNMSVVELQTLPQQEQQLEVERLTQQEMHCPIALEKDSWLRVTLIRLGTQSHILLLGLHNLLTDERGGDIFLEELSVLYEAFLLGKPSLLPELPLQYGDYALIQRQSLTPEYLQTKFNYWKQWLSKEPQPLQLPTDKPLSSVQTFRAGILDYQLSFELTHGLKILSQQRRVTLFTTLLTATVILLYHYSGCEEIVMGVPTSDRNDWKFKPLIGRMNKVLMLCIELGGNPSFLELLTHVQQEMVLAMANQDVPFEQVAKTLHLERKRNKPFFRMFIDFLLEPLKEELDLQGLTVTSLPLNEFVMRADLSLVIWEKNTSNITSLEGKWQYKKDLFEPETIARMAENFQTVLEAIVAAPHRSVAELKIKN